MNYPEHYQELTGLMKQLGKEIPDTMGSFTGLHKNAVDAGAGREEIMETIGVSVLMGGGPSVMYGCEALQALDQFTKEGS